jgi:hypothetical protein
MITMQYNEKRSTQIAAQLIREAGGELNYMLLLKLLYLIDREALLQWGTPLTGDAYISARYGPLLRLTHDLITEQIPEAELKSSFWKNHVETDGYQVRLKADTGDDELSQADEHLISDIFGKYFAKYKELGGDVFAFCDYLHTILPEYKSARHGESFALDYHDILVAGQKRPEEINETESLLNSIGKMQALR